ncbi:MAG: hypothetical protein IJK23_00165 [Clostridia bacterium]|nr:hypothetical protein [Clostridia bacterium]
MQCPKCGGDIPFYDIRPNCKHCGVNIWYFSQQTLLIRDAKRTELEAAAARMVIARIKAAFIGSKAAIARLVITVFSIAVLMLPFGSVKLTAPFYERTLSAGLIGVIKGAIDGSLMKIPEYLQSAMFSRYTKAFLLPEGVLAVLVVLAVVIFCVYLLSFLRLEKMTKVVRNASLIGAIIALLGQIAVLIMNFVTPQPETPAAEFHAGYGGFAVAAVWFALYFINRLMLKNGIEPTYRENDIKRRELLHKFRAGEIDLDSLPLPVMESEEEREERLKALAEALKAEEEGKEL